uniref:RING-type domain-containing protein n=1 Tax=Oryza barthii TaxID=65489 RepID=A0A0D3G7V5_9ORYZ
MMGGICALVVGDAEEDETELCAICVHVMVPGRPVRVLPRCTRAFHHDCVHRWRTISSRCLVCNAWVTQRSQGPNRRHRPPSLI